MLSMGFQQCTKNPSSTLSPTPKLLKNPIFPSLNTPILSFYPLNQTKSKPIKISASSPSSSILDNKNGNKQGKEKLGVVVKPMERPRLVLKFIWMEKNLGLAIDQVIPGGNGSIPLSPYYFWPRKDAWEELKVMLERKAWISKKEVVVLLNQATDIINLWQQSGEDLD
ncbi:hypothetical protein BUALT_Bualt11G0054600 [Buddleja alternifolia]|uniref:30S ribosomal protein 3, chloroplastic n=1 Tax=Buddleja alternifolia TaxID=168488 RepID=A0AAV6X3J8_9LAMI|nr:hypothetical protein BUALT_Bualt11G0054600 [Buddleja alternifolia]